MTNLSHVVQDERTARMVLSMIVEPDDAVTGRLLGELGALELLRLAERDDAVPGLSAVDAQVWRAQFERSDARTLGQRIVEAERAGIGTLIPGDKEWPSALDDLGDRRPYVLWTRGTTSFLARPLSDLVTITGARAATSYGEHVAAELASDLANAERIVVAGGAYGIEGAAHRAAWHPTATRSQSWRTALIAPTRWVTVNCLSEWLTSASWSARFHQARCRRAIASLLARA
jgi:DNA processing protein